MKQHKKTLVGGALVLTLAALIAKIVGAIYRIPLSSLLSELGSSYYNAAYTIYSPIYMLAMSGLPFATAKLIAENMGAGRYNDIKVIRKASAIIFFIVGITASLALFALSGVYVNYSQTPQALYSVWAIAPSIFISCLMATKRGYWQGMKDMRPTAVSQIVEVFAKLLFGLSGAYLTSKFLTEEYQTHGTVFGEAFTDPVAANVTILTYVSSAAIFAVTLSIVIGWLYLEIITKIRGEQITPEQYASSPPPLTKKHYAFQIIKFGVPVTITSIVTSIAALVDTITIKRGLSHVIETDLPTLLASYDGKLDGIPVETLLNELYGAYVAIPIVLFGLIPSLTAAFNSSSIPYIASSHAKKDHEGQYSAQKQLIRFGMFIAAPIGYGICALATPISTMLFPRLEMGIAVTGQMTMMLGIAAIFSALLSAVMSIYNAIGRVEIPLILGAGVAVFKIVWNVTLVRIPSLNLKISPLGSLIVYALAFFIAFVLLKKITGMKPPLWSCVGKPLVAGALCGVSAFGVYRLLIRFVGNTTSVLLAVFVGAVVYFGVNMLLRTLKREDLDGIPGGPRLADALAKIGVME